MSLNITAFDAFCGAGGSSTGIAAAGVEVTHAANHWQLAIDTHSTNHPLTNHDCMDLRLAHPSLFKRTNIAWFSPECTNHSLAKGRKRKNLSQLDLWGENGVDPAEERSRATMREVVEFSEYHRYEIVIVENVVDIRYWEHYDAWLQDMYNLGYDHKPLYLNAMFFGVPQSRDRVYVVFWKRGNKAPDLDFRPFAYCIDHGIVGAVQSFKKAQHWGRYGKKRQYVYCCSQCGRIIEPFTLPASGVINWSIASQRIGDRARELKPKTIKRILEGLRRFAPETLVMDTSYSQSEDSGKVKSAFEPLATQTTRQTFALIKPFLVSYMNQDAPPRAVDEPLYTVPTLNAMGLVLPQLVSTNYYDDRTIPVDQPMPTQTTQAGKWALLTPFIAELRKDCPPRRIEEALPTITAGGGHHALVTPFMVVLKDSTHGLLPPYSLKDPLTTIVAAGSQHALITPFVMAYYGNAPTYASVAQPMPTATAVERHALIEPEEMLDDCGFRMLEPEELKRGMSFPDAYIILGNKRDQVRQVGNAVACNVAQAIVERCVAALA